jgi:2-oxoglutarate ferredoxin oxidoreductase subunit gamma
MTKEIRISGSGGQGVILAGLILAEAAGIWEGNEVLHMEDYGGAMRGGAVRSEVIIAERGEVIWYPAVDNADILLALTQDAALRWADVVKEDGIIVYDTTYVKRPPNSQRKIFALPIASVTENELGGKMGANMAALGFVCKIADLVSEDSLRRAMLRYVPRGTQSINTKALEIGFEIARRHR